MRKFGKKAMELAINTVIMLIIGIILFGLGIGLFTKFASSSEDQVDNLRSQIIDDISSLECNDDAWICAPTLTVALGESKTGRIYVTNRKDTRESFKIKYYLKNLDGSDDPADPENKGLVKKSGCGSLLLTGIADEIEVDSGSAISFPIHVHTGRVQKEKCSFTTILEVVDRTGTSLEKTPFIVRVE
jgi:hypothetical protein